MNDLISRHKIIKAIDKFIPADPMKSDYTQGISVGLALATRCIEEFSQETDEYSQGLVKDLISRQDAKDVVDMELDAIDHVPEWVYDRLLTALDKVPSAQAERTCVNCGRTVNNGGWYADGGTRCPIEEHYALPKDGYCHLWEKRNVTDDDYPERRTDE